MAEPVKLQSSNRVWIGVIAAIVVVAVAVLTAINVTGGDSKGSSSNLAGIDDATTLFDGIPQSGLEIGKTDAPVAIVEYMDLQCPFCRNAATSTVPEILTRFVRTDQAKLQLQPLGFVRSDVNDDSKRGALALIAAGEQGRAGQFAEVVFRNQGNEGSGWLTDALIEDVAGAIDLDVGKLNDARKGDSVNAAFDQIGKTAVTNKVDSTPTFIVKGPKGQVAIVNHRNVAEFAQAIEKVK